MKMGPRGQKRSEANLLSRGELELSMGNETDERKKTGCASPRAGFEDSQWGSNFVV